MATIHYIPSVICVKCGNELVTDLTHQHDAKSNRRFLLARHHGQKAEVQFATSLGAQVKIFE